MYHIFKLLKIVVSRECSKDAKYETLTKYHKSYYKIIYYSIH